MRVKVDQIELQIRDYEQEGDAIIFLHFGGANLMMWQRIIRYFQERYRILLVDMRGHGKSDQPEIGYHMDEMAGDVIGIMQHLNLKRAHIVGSSLGAEVGLGLAANYPDQVISLACDGALYNEFGSFGIWEGSEADFNEHVERQLEKIRNTPERTFTSVDLLVDDRREILKKYGWWNKYVEEVERYGASKVGEGKYVKGFRKQARENYMEHFFHYRFENYYRKVKCPLLMLPEDEESENELTKVAMEGLRKLAVHGEIVKVSGWVHPYGWLMNPENICRTILKFLDETTK